MEFKELRKILNPGLIIQMRSRGILQSFCEAKGIKYPILYNIETCKIDAQRFDGRAAWNKKSGGAYAAARKNGWLDVCCAHMTSMTKPSGFWTLNTCKADALRFDGRMEWNKKSKSAYTIASKNGWLDDCCAHMTTVRKLNNYWNLENCKADALRFNTKTEWQNISSGYQAALKMGWLDECCAHMSSVRKLNNYWTIELCKADALKYDMRNVWKKNSYPAYQAAVNHGWLDECCVHMKKHTKIKTVNL